jgi:hypothetical protein
VSLCCVRDHHLWVRSVGLGVFYRRARAELVAASLPLCVFNGQGKLRASTHRMDDDKRKKLETRLEAAEADDADENVPPVRHPAGRVWGTLLIFWLERCEAHSFVGACILRGRPQVRASGAYRPERHNSRRGCGCSECPSRWPSPWDKALTARFVLVHARSDLDGDGKLDKLEAHIAS